MEADGRYSVAFPKRWWYPACPSKDLGASKPLGVELMETPVALFRDRAGLPAALLDRCPHRNFPLSEGRVAPDGCLQCGYHGWRFDGTGACAAVPGLVGEPAGAAARSARSFTVREHDGFVWIWGDPESAPDGEPLRLPTFDGKGTGEVVFAYDLDCSLHAALENALDVPHTAFLHAGVFRGGEPREIEAVRRGLPGGVEVQYLGEPVGLGRFRGDEDDLTFDHWDRFLLPAVAQIEYQVEGWLHIVNTILHLPLSPFRTRAWFVVRYWTRLPARLSKPIVLARGKQILRQDARALARQTASVRRFGEERYTSTQLDLMGNVIWRLLRQAERAEHGGNAGRADGDGAGATGVEVTERSVTFRI